jgi:ferredoxin
MVDIYVYSGRGNSLSVARDIGASISGSRMISAAIAARGPRIDLAEDRRIGLVFPVIDVGLPASIRALIGNFSVPGRPPFVFAVATTGGMPGGILLQADRLLRRRGLAVSLGLLMPFSLKVEDEEIRKQRMAVFLQLLRQRAGQRLPPCSLVDRVVLTGLGNLAARGIIPREDRKFRVGPSCDGCGFCRRLCPAGNIDLAGGAPRWKGRCEQCGACFAWCPRGAITGDCLAARTLYRNPRVALADMLAFSKSGSEGSAATLVSGGAALPVKIGGSNEVSA